MYFFSIGTDEHASAYLCNGCLRINSQATTPISNALKQIVEQFLWFL